VPFHVIERASITQAATAAIAHAIKTKPGRSSVVATHALDSLVNSAIKKYHTIISDNHGGRFYATFGSETAQVE
jgi:phosphohistidine swiveling domain-containing protein